MLTFKIYYEDLIDMTQNELVMVLAQAGFDFNNEIIRYYDEHDNSLIYSQ